MDRFALGLRAARVATTPPMAAAVLVGTMYAVHDGHRFLPGSFVLALFGAVLAQLGGNVVAGIGDHLAGGPGLAAHGDVSPHDAAAVAAVCFAGALGCGVLLGLTAAASVFGIGLAGFALAMLYALPPLALSHLGRGLGEAAVFLAFGPLPVAGAYAVQAGGVSGGVLVASLPVGFFTTAVLWAHHFTRAGVDARIGRLSPVVVLGERRALIGAWALPALSWLAVHLNVSGGDYPSWCYLALLTAPPMVWKLARLRGANPPEAYADLTRATAVLATLTGVLIAAGFAIEALSTGP